MIGTRVRQARELRRLTQAELARKASVSQPTIADVESGQLRLTDDVRSRIAFALEVPDRFLDHMPARLTDGSLGLTRASSRLPKVDLASARQRAALAVELLRGLRKGIKRLELRIPTLADADPEAAALITRSALGFGSDEPIPHLTRALERAGVVVMPLDMNVKREDGKRMYGFSSWGSDPTDEPYIFVDKGQTAFRLRFTIAHELGHLVLGHDAPKGPVAQLEAAANDFAGHLLLPREALEADLGAGTDLMTLSTLKGKWGVSMKAIVKQAYRLALISEGQYKYANVRLSGLYGKSEPADMEVAPERPSLFRQLASIRGAGSVDVSAIAKATSLPLDIVADVLAEDDSDARLRRLLE